ncbi:hypothetical protein LTR36_010859 [Oleoguttula mirabilis]|uniref:Uncharacterized protein n=1 Tax=Oleoguttula mirabilis TaxID=1507867 RepID=A0AAV9J486_9PEZI|nr:hypothetical protein LTR36_010859 [Oleoguttula mirabilis]
MDLTFGIELEFVCVYPTNCFSDHSLSKDTVDETDAAQAIYVALKKRGIPATGFEAISGEVPQAAPAYSRWRVHTDHSVMLSAEEAKQLPKGYRQGAIELSSRKFSLYGEDWQTEIHEVLQVLSDLESNGCRMLTNASTGFHVHIGNGTQRIPLHTAKNVFQLVTAFAGFLDEIHPAARSEDPVPEDLHLHCYLPPCWFHKNNGRSPAGSSVLDWLDTIEGAQTYEELIALFEVQDQNKSGLFVGVDGHNSAYNFDNLYRDESYGIDLANLLGTIEFRQHAGTLNEKAIINGILLTSQLVQYCHKASDMNMLRVLACSVGPMVTAGALFDTICLQLSVREFYVHGGSLASNSRAEFRVLVQGDRLAALIANNQQEDSAAKNPRAVQAVIAANVRNGSYGIDAAVRVVDIPPRAIGRYVREACMNVRAAIRGATAEKLESLARSQVLIRLAALYGKKPPVEEGLPGVDSCLFRRS